MIEDGDFSLNGTFFGWGAGGANNMPLLVKILQELGFFKVVGILDKNKEKIATNLSEQNSNYHFFAIPADDIRSKKTVKEKPAVKGLLDNDNIAIRPEFRAETKCLFSRANSYLTDPV